MLYILHFPFAVRQFLVIGKILYTDWRAVHHKF